jgi:hypothetical protein
MSKRSMFAALTAVAWSIPGIIMAQNPVPTTQPAVLIIYREDVKVGHGAEHENVEAGWPAAYAKVKSPNSYIAITSITGAPEAWFLAPYANWKGLGDAVKLDGDPAIAPELARLQKADAEHISTARGIHLVGRPDLSTGTFPSVAKNRFYEITIFRVRSGHEQEFEGIARIFQAAYKKTAPEASWRLYQVVAGMPGPVYMVFSSQQALADLDALQARGMAVMGSFSADEQKALQKFASEGLINSETQRFAVSGRMSYVDDATAATDPNFWRPGIKASK